jgi:hypothetical protein
VRFLASSINSLVDGSEIATARFGRITFDMRRFLISLKVGLTAFVLIGLASGCGGGGGSSSAQSPTLDQLYAPFLGTYTAVWNQPSTKTTGSTTMYLTADKGTQAQGNLTTSIVGAYIATSYNMPGGAPDSPFWSWAVAYPDGDTHNAAFTQITQLHFVFTTAQDAPEGQYVSPIDAQMILGLSGNPNVLTGTITTEAGTADEEQYAITLTKQ